MVKAIKNLTAAALLAGMSTSAFSAGLPFVVDNSLGYTDVGVGTTFTADILSGNYQEVIVVTNAATGAFDATILLSYTSFQIFPNVSGLTTDYGLYSVINVSGNVTNNNLPTSISTGNWSGSFNMVLDVETDTNTFIQAAVTNGGVNFSAAELDDDIELFTGNIASGGSVGTAVGQGSGGFGLTGDNVTLSAAGENFFIDPDPFYNMLISDGDLEDFFIQIDFTAENVIQRFTGEASVEFSAAEVPEPSVIALLGLGIAGLAFGARRTK
ncbi:flocculation-associated PEP-CTERM protein PepA [Agaribacter flavus]|uniref:Flocculation-associated PEP-CTERM protein PepA n=1 Tax=Agaribacter flavus TaxID=1902781 RepID=A0ABV7FSC9_9ALTE